MVTRNPIAEHKPTLTDEQRMLVQIRDTLYEGSWDDFLRDLAARSEGRPHVFAIGEASPELRTTIERHVSLIHEMQDLERRGRTAR